MTHRMFAFLICATIILITGTLMMNVQKQPTDNEVRLKIESLNCKRVGFAGKYAKVVYNCNEGLYLYSEIRHWVYQEKNK